MSSLLYIFLWINTLKLFTVFILLLVIALKKTASWLFGRITIYFSVPTVVRESFL